MFLRRRKKLEVDLGEIEDEREALSSFLKSKLKVDVIPRGNKILVNSENLSPKKLKRIVNKFVYHRNLMNEYWVSLKGSVVRINRFKDVEKHKKRKKETIPPSIIKHGW